MDQIIFCLVRVENRKISFSKGLLCRRNGRVVKDEPEEVDRQRRDILQSDTDGRPVSGVRLIGD